MSRRFAQAAAAALVLALAATTSWGHETDQWTTPPDGLLADVGHYLNEYVVVRLEAAVERTNRRIEKALQSHELKMRRSRSRKRSRQLRSANHKSSTETLEYLQSPEGVVKQFRNRFPLGPALIDSMERKIRHDRQLKALHPGQRTNYKPGNFECIFVGVDPMPHSNLARLWRSSTINAYGTHFGIDKVGHFVHIGYDMYVVYRRNIRAGRLPEESMRRAMRSNVDGAGGEKGVFGNIMVGSYSNADLSSNYVGCLFFRNVTEPVTLKGAESPSMLVRDGPFWKIADHVRGDPEFFARYISHHYDESLNPSVYVKTMRRKIKQNVKQRHEAYLKYYCERAGHPREKEYFDDLLKQLSTYYGQDYGHRGGYFNLVTVGNTWQGG